ncbi:CCR4-NOT transcription complex subunit regena isoform X2 [Haematobia irritans]|uniref:CCR4-NOT transcription complex subunit regena isoform X2 n=1 Tax=Haematobia irritans TaxID=7368 RepID=UPI003F50BEC9
MEIMANLNFQQPPRSIANASLTGRTTGGFGGSSLSGHVTPTSGMFPSGANYGQTQPQLSPNRNAQLSVGGPALTSGNRANVFSQRPYVERRMQGLGAGPMSNMGNFMQTGRGGYGNSGSGGAAGGPLNNFHNVFGGSGDTTTPALLDPSEFPSLTNVRGQNDQSLPQTNPLQPPGSKPYGNFFTSFGMVKQPTSEQSEFTMSNEDFPALPGTHNSDGTTNAGSIGLTDSNNLDGTDKTMNSIVSNSGLGAVGSGAVGSGGGGSTAGGSSGAPGSSAGGSGTGGGVGVVGGGSSSTSGSSSGGVSGSGGVIGSGIGGIVNNSGVSSAQPSGSSGGGSTTAGLSGMGNSGHYQQQHQTNQSSNQPGTDLSALQQQQHPNDNSSDNKLVKTGVQTSPDGKVTNIPASMVNNQFGMVGLLTFMRAAESDPNLVTLASGIDLTGLGLNLNSQESLHPTFAGPFADHPCRAQDVEYNVPPEYLINFAIRDKLSSPLLKKLQEDLLFFLFYTNIGDIMQLMAAAELHSREWRYHIEEKIWITRIPGLNQYEKNGTKERGTFYYFDAQSWKRLSKVFQIDPEKLDKCPNLSAFMNINGQSV